MRPDVCVGLFILPFTKAPFITLEGIWLAALMTLNLWCLANWFGFLLYLLRSMAAWSGKEIINANSKRANNKVVFIVATGGIATLGNGYIHFISSDA